MANVAPTGALNPFLDDNGDPIPGGRLYTFDVGTSTPRLTWADAAEVVPLSNPIILDASGWEEIYWRGNYRVELRDAANVLVRTWASFNVPDLASANVSIQWQQAGGNVGTAGQFGTVNFASNLASLVAGGGTLTITIGGTGTVTYGGGVFNGAAGLLVTGGPFSSRGFEDLATADAWQINAAGVLRDVGNAGAGGQPTVVAGRITSAQTSGTTCLWNGQVTDVSGEYDPTTGIYTALLTGWRLFGYVGIIANSSGGAVNRGLFATTTGGSGQQIFAGGQDNRNIANGVSGYVQSTGLAFLVAGDTMRIEANAAFTATENLATTTGNGFWVRQLG